MFRQWTCGYTNVFYQRLKKGTYHNGPEHRTDIHSRPSEPNPSWLLVCFSAACNDNCLTKSQENEFAKSAKTQTLTGITRRRSIGRYKGTFKNMCVNEVWGRRGLLVFNLGSHSAKGGPQTVWQRSVLWTICKQRRPWVGWPLVVVHPNLIKCHPVGSPSGTLGKRSASFNAKSSWSWCNISKLLTHHVNKTTRETNLSWSFLSCVLGSGYLIRTVLRTLS